MGVVVGAITPTGKNKKKVILDKKLIPLYL